MSEQRIDVSNGCYLLVDGAIPSGDPRSPSLIRPGDAGGAMVATGTRYGDVGIVVDVCAADPGPVDGPWERVEESTLVAGGDRIEICTVDVGELGLPTLAVTPGRPYHVRVHVRGFAAGKDRPEFDDGGEPVELHHVQLWT